MKTQLRLALGQLNFLVGDIFGNLQKIEQAAQKAKNELNADVLVLPELALTGYPPEDLIFRQDFHQDIAEALTELKRISKSIDLIVGYPEKNTHGIYNAACYLHNGEIEVNYHKRFLPNYGVFDEKRYFTKGQQGNLFHIKQVPISMLICEDLWHLPPYKQAVESGAKLIISINASPYDYQKAQQREEMICQQVKKHHVPIAYTHCVGGQDEVIFDGGSFVIDSQANLCAHAGFFEEKLQIVDIEYDGKEVSVKKQPLPAEETTEQHIYQALCLGVKDYITKNGFNGAVLGLSGGIDSALTLAIACDALGAENVHAVMMPTRYTSQMSLDDAEQIAKNFNVQYSNIPIEPLFEASLQQLEPLFSGLPTDTTEENLQARCRGLLLMAISNKTGKLVLTTGNKSEMAVGYATLYGDMAGGFAVLKDAYKTLVFQLANYRNSNGEIIPQRIISRPPSAELAHDQVDEDSLPAYAELDQILQRYIELDQGLHEIVAAGFTKETVARIINMINKSEYKRRQAPPGVRITERSFGRERRYPMTSGYRYQTEK